jgi:hypothetical protein
MKAAEGLDAKPGPKNAKLYNANALFMSIYCGNQRAIWWEGSRGFCGAISSLICRHF